MGFGAVPQLYGDIGHTDLTCILNAIGIAIAPDEITQVDGCRRAGGSGSFEYNDASIQARDGNDIGGNTDDVGKTIISARRVDVTIARIVTPLIFGGVLVTGIQQNTDAIIARGGGHQGI